MKLKSTIAAIAVAFATASQAAPQFGVNTDAMLGLGNGETFVANTLLGSAQTFLQITSANTIAGHGYVRFDSFKDSADNVVYGLASPGTGTSTPLILWGEYSYTTKLTSGSIGALGSSYNITSLTLSVWAEKNNSGTVNDSTFTVANAANPLSASVVRSADSVKLGDGTLVSGAASFNTGGGSSFNPKIDLALTTTGKDFFYDPDPFYSFIFTSATNTFAGFGVGATSATISGPAGADFSNVPEPGSLALAGLSLFGLAAVRRRKQV